MNKLLIFFLSVLIGISSNNSYSQQESNNIYVSDLDTALKLSKETNQKIVLIFSASWCGYCGNLKNDFSKIKEFDDKIICIIDTDGERRLTKKFKIKSLPTSIMLDNDGDEINRITGYEKDSYKRWLLSK